MDNPNKQTYTNNNMIAGILFFGEDAASLGMDYEDIDRGIDARVDLLVNLGFVVAGSLLGTPEESNVSFFAWSREGDGAVTFDHWALASKVYREAFPTFDGHIALVDLTHNTTSMVKAADAFHSMMENGFNLDDLLG